MSARAELISTIIVKHRLTTLVLAVFVFGGWSSRLEAHSVEAAESLKKGQVAEKAGKFDQALDLYQEAIRKAESDDPNGLQAAEAAGYVARSRLRSGQWADAERLLRRGLEIQESKLGVDHPDVAVSLNNLGQALRNQDRFDEAVAVYRRALAITQKKFGPNHLDNAAQLAGLGQTLGKLGKHSEAEAMLRQSLKLRSDILGPQDLLVGITAFRLGAEIKAQRRYDEAELLLRGALETVRCKVGPNHSYVAEIQFELVDALFQQKRYGEVISELDRMLEIHPTNGVLYAFRGQTQYLRCEWSKARNDLEKAIELKCNSELEMPWLFLSVARESGIEATRARIKVYLSDGKIHPGSDWPGSVPAFMAGDVAEEQLLKSAESTDVGKGRDQRAAVCFFAGTWRLCQNDREGAMRLFQLSVGTCAYSRMESVAAEVELGRLQGRCAVDSERTKTATSRKSAWRFDNVLMTVMLGAASILSFRSGLRHWYNRKSGPEYLQAIVKKNAIRLFAMSLLADLMLILQVLLG